MRTQAEAESQKPAGGTIKIVNTISQPGQRYISATEHPGSRLCQIFFVFRILDPWSPHLPTTCIRIQRYLLIEPRNRRFRSFVYRPSAANTPQRTTRQESNLHERYYQEKKTPVFRQETE